MMLRKFCVVLGLSTVLLAVVGVRIGTDQAELVSEPRENGQDLLDKARALILGRAVASVHRNRLEERAHYLAGPSVASTYGHSLLTKPLPGVEDDDDDENDEKEAADQEMSGLLNPQEVKDLQSKRRRRRKRKSPQDTKDEDTHASEWDPQTKKDKSDIYYANDEPRN